MKSQKGTKRSISRKLITATTMFVLVAATMEVSVHYSHATLVPKSEKNNKRDPCSQFLVAQGKANGLEKRCEVPSGGGAAKGDFNGDGFADLAIGVPDENANGETDSGVVNVIYGGANGLSSAGDQLLGDVGYITTTGSFVSNGDYDYFGSALAAGDFDGDGLTNIAIEHSGRRERGA